MDRLDGAVASPRVEFAGQPAYTTLFEKVAALGLGMVQGHVFLNGNKRSGLMAMVMMLRINGWDLIMPPEISSLMMLRMASDGNRISLADVATLLGAFSYFSSIPRNVFKRNSSIMPLINGGAIIVDGEDAFPVAPPIDRTKNEYRMQAEVIARDQRDLMTAEEKKLYADSFTWPDDLFVTFETWSAVTAHARHEGTRRRMRMKRIGKRRRPHNGGRTVPKQCRPIRR
jgi:prophage maintenance system killer protein